MLPHDSFFSLIKMRLKITTFAVNSLPLLTPPLLLSHASSDTKSSEFSIQTLTILVSLEVWGFPSCILWYNLRISSGGIDRGVRVATKLVREWYGHHSGKGYWEYSGGIPSLVLSSLPKKIDTWKAAICYSQQNAREDKAPVVFTPRQTSRSLPHR